MGQYCKVLARRLSSLFLFIASCDYQLGATSVDSETLRGTRDQLALMVHGSRTTSYRLQPVYLAIEQWGLVEPFLRIGATDFDNKVPERTAAILQLYHLPDPVNGGFVVPSNSEAADGLPSFYFELSRLMSGAWEGQHGLIALRGEIVLEQFQLLENHLDIRAVISITEAVEQQCSGCPSQPASVTGTLSYHGPFPLSAE